MQKRNIETKLNGKREDLFREVLVYLIAELRRNSISFRANTEHGFSYAGVEISDEKLTKIYCPFISSEKFAKHWEKAQQWGNWKARTLKKILPYAYFARGKSKFPTVSFPKKTFQLIQDLK